MLVEAICLNIIANWIVCVWRVDFSGLHLDIVQPSMPELTARNNSGEEVSLYEQKLIQVWS
jgi:hypothetical protein